MIACVCFLSLAGMAQTSTEIISRELSFDKRGANNALLILNINGEVKVEGYEGDKILVEIEKKIIAKTEERLEIGKQEVQLGILDRADTLILYVGGVRGPITKIKKNYRRRSVRQGWGNWGYDWNCEEEDCQKKYDYKMTFVVKVPFSLNVLASTVNNGDVIISNVKGKVLADNINGSIRLTGISGSTLASTINGNVDLDYSGNPSEDSRYYSLNGDIHANFRKGLAAQLTFKSFNGDFYSSIEDISPMAVVVEKYDKGEGIRYRVNGNRYKVRQGGPLLDFETFNGDVFLKEKTN